MCASCRQLYWRSTAFGGQISCSGDCTLFTKCALVPAPLNVLHVPAVPLRAALFNALHVLTVSSLTKGFLLYACRKVPSSTTGATEIRSNSATTDDNADAEEASCAGDAYTNDGTSPAPEQPLIAVGDQTPATNMQLASVPEQAPSPVQVNHCAPLCPLIGSTPEL